MNALFSNILTASFHGSIVIAAVLILRLVLRKAPKKYICYLWLLAGLRLLMPFQIQSDLSLQPASLPDTAIRWEQPEPIARDAGESPEISQAVQPSETTAAANREAETAAPLAETEAAFAWESLLPLVWVCVAAALVMCSAVSYRHLRKKVRDARPIQGGWECDNIDTAFILGFIRPRIYIPTGMSPSVRKHILDHEHTHLDKGDHWIKMIGYLALCLHWFNPLVWAAYILLCKDIEMACDQRVVQFMELPERKAYSSALLSCSSGRVHYMASPVAFGEVSVKNRILSILNYRKPSFWMGFLATLAIVFVAVCLVTSPTESGADASGQNGESQMGDNSGYLAPAELPEEEDPGWGLSLVAEPLSPTTMNLYYGVGVEDIHWDGRAIYKDFPYWLERWNGESWEALPLLVDSPTYEGSCSTELSMDNAHSFYCCDTLDWSLIYGALTQGDYRIGIRPIRNGEVKAHYATFHIYANTLAGEEAEAVTRCETALDKLVGDDYGGTIWESNEFGSLMPTMRIYRLNDSRRVDLYYGDICYASSYDDHAQTLMEGWDKAFRTDENKFISFPEGESRISSEEISFLSAWEEDGRAYRQYNTYTFDESGKITGMERLIQSEGEDGVVTQSQRRFTLDGFSRGDTDDPNRDPKDSWEEAQDSPWRIFFRVDDDCLTASGGDVTMGLQNTTGVSNYTTDGKYWLEEYNGEIWEKRSAAGTPSLGQDSYRLKSILTMVPVDWTAHYGELSPGLYRMGMNFSNGEESMIQYAEFRIYSQGGIQGQGGEEAIARIDAAVEQLCRGNYYVTEYRNYGQFRQEEKITNGYWKYNGVCVTDYYDSSEKAGYSHSAAYTKDDPNADLFYDAWKNALNWNHRNTQVLFPEGASLISQERIVFATAGTGEYAVLTRYDVRFDEEGNLSSITREYTGPLYGNEGAVTWYFEEKPDGEIQAWVERQSQT